MYQISATANESQTTNILTNGSFDDQTEGWTLDGTASYDGNNYGTINKSVRFSGSSGGSITQEISLGNITDENKEVASISGSLISIGCNNEGSHWCTRTGSADNLDPVNITMTLSDGTNTEVLTHDFTSDYNDGVITTNYSVSVIDTFETDSTSLTINYFGADTGNKAGKFGTIIDDLSLTLGLNDITIVQEVETPQIEQIQTNESILTATELSEATIDDINTGIIDITTSIDTSVDISNSLAVVSIQDLDIDMEVADMSVQIEMPVLVDTGVDNLEGDISIPEPDLPEIELPEIELPEIELPSELPEIEDIEIESIEVDEVESDLDSDIESEIEESIEETPAELEEQNLEEDLEESESEESESENEGENEGEVEVDENSQLSKNDNSSTKKTETKKEQKTEKKVEKKEEKKSKKAEAPKVESDIIVDTVELPTVVAFSEIYFANTYKDTLDLGADEVQFYEPDRFDSKDYTEANIAFLNISSDSNSEWDMVVESTKFRVEEFKRDGR